MTGVQKPAAVSVKAGSHHFDDRAAVFAAVTRNLAGFAGELFEVVPVPAAGSETFGAEAVVADFIRRNRQITMAAAQRLLALR